MQNKFAGMNPTARLEANTQTTRYSHPPESILPTPFADQNG